VEESFDDRRGTMETDRKSAKSKNRREVLPRNKVRVCEVEEGNGVDLNNVHVAEADALGR
jgi:hypothetical protein